MNTTNYEERKMKSSLSDSRKRVILRDTQESNDYYLQLTESQLCLIDWLLKYRFIEDIQITEVDQQIYEEI